MHRPTAHDRRRAAFSCTPLALTATAALLLAACGPSKADLRADSLRAEAAAKATQDSIDAVKLVTVDSLIGAGYALEPSQLREREAAHVEPEMPRVRPD